MNSTISGFMMGFGASMILTTFIIGELSESHKTIVKHGCAHYDPITSHFTWNEDKK